MSFIRKAIARRVFRAEDWKSLYGATDDDTKPLTFTSDLVTGEYTNLAKWQHLLMVARRDPVAHKVCVGLSKNVTDDWFVIKKIGEDDELEDHPKNKEIQEELTRMNAKFHFTQALIGMRIFGKSALVFNFNKHRDDFEVGDGGQIASLDVFTDENMIIPHDAYDEVTGEPKHIKIYPNATNEAITDNILWEEVQWWNVDPVGRSYDGYSALYSAWDLMTYLRESIDANSWSHKKFGAGLWMWFIKGGMDETMRAKYEDSLQDIGYRRAVAVESSDVDRVEWSGPPSGGSTSIIEGADFNLGMISSATDIPKDIYTGVSAGAITGSETNNKALYSTISKIQSDITPYVLDALVRMGYDTGDMILEWTLRYATDELEQAQIRLLNAQAAQMEKQTEEGDPLEKFSQAFGQGEDPNKEQNPAGVQS